MSSWGKGGTTHEQLLKVVLCHNKRGLNICMAQMGRSLKSGAKRRIQVRVPPDIVEEFDRMTSDQLGEIMAIAIRLGIRADSPFGAPVKTVIRPENPKTKTVARVGQRERTIQIVFPERRDDFRGVLKKLNYKWTEWCWSRAFGKTVDLCDRLSEVSHALLCAGFCVQVEYTEVMERAIAATYEPEAFRVVDVSTQKPYEGWFVFKYPRSDDFYDELTCLTAAKYADGAVRIPPEHFAEVEDFAEQNEFTFTPKAIATLEESRAAWEQSVIVRPSRRKRKEKPQNPLDSVEVEIPNALIDDLA